jgi:hypothetical protein
MGGLSIGCQVASRSVAGLSSVSPLRMAVIGTPEVALADIPRMTPKPAWRVAILQRPCKPDAPFDVTVDVTVDVGRDGYSRGRIAICRIRQHVSGRPDSERSLLSVISLCANW